MKRILIMLLVLMSLFQATVSAGMFSGNFRDPFNNSLFEVVAESDYYDDFNIDFEYTDKKYNDDYSLAKIVKTKINYDGTYETKDLCDYMESEKADEVFWAEVGDKYSNSNHAFNDGLIYAGEEDGCYLGGLKDINNKIKYECPTFDYFTYSYNLGLLQEGENNGYAGVDITEREYKTTFTRIMTDRKVYEFNCKISNFNDDGYALMCVDKKFYVIKLKKGIIPTVFYNGKKIKFDQIPVIDNGRTLVPLRAIFETFGAKVSWDEKTKTVTATKDDTEIKLTVDKTTAYKNGNAIKLDVPAKIINGRTLVPVRFVSDCFNANVKWDETMLKVSLTK